ncbi:MAG: MFS transporter [Acidobacteriota bacterium]|nr:MFS transporter [Acidobacteriota bacterium]
MASRRAWGVVGAFCAVGAVTQMVWLTFAAVTTPAATHYHVSSSAIGWLAQPFVLAYVLLAVPGGLLLDRHLRRWLAVGALLTAVGAAVRIEGSYAALLTGAFVAAVAQPLVLNAVTGLVAQYLPEAKRPAGIAVASASIFAGMVIAFLLGVVLSTPRDMATLVLTQAIIAAAAATVLAWRLVRPAPYPPAGPALGMSAFAAAWRRPLIRLLCAFIALPFGVFIALTTWTQDLLKPAGVSSDTAGTILIAMVLAGDAGAATLPVWAARRRREVDVATLAAWAMAVACLVLALVPSALSALVALVVVGFLALAVLPIVLELTERAAPDSESTASGLIWLAGNLGGLVVASVTGLLSGVPHLAFGFLALATVSALPTLRRLRGPVGNLAAVP